MKIPIEQITVLVNFASDNNMHVDECKAVIQFLNELEAAALEPDMQEEINLNFDKCWNEFKSLFPKCTPNGRMLHSNPKGCKEKYKDVYLFHDQVMNGLKNEINHRKKHGTEQWWKMMSTWLNQEEWEMYQEEIKPEKKVNNSKKL